MNSDRFRFHHMGVAVPNLEKAAAQYEGLFAYRMISGPFEDPIQKVAVCFLKRDFESDYVLELVAPLSGDSPIQRTLKKGGGAYHLCYEVDGLDEAMAHCMSQGCVKVSDPVPAVAFDNRRIAWLFTPAQQLIELLER